MLTVRGFTLYRTGAEPAVTVTDTASAALRGKTSFLSVCRTSCRLYLRQNTSSDWFCPPVSIPLTERIRDVFKRTAPSESDIALLRQWLSMCPAEAVSIELSEALPAEWEAYVREVFPYTAATEVRVIREPLVKTGVWMLAKRAVWG